MIRTYVLRTDMLPDESSQSKEWEACMRKVSKERAEKIRRIRHAQAKKQSLGAGLLLRYVSRQKGSETRITHGAYGKPACAEVPFNLSHTEDAVILSIWEGEDTSEVMIGCDIEKVRTYRPGVARRFFTSEEYRSLEAMCDPQAQAEWFCRYWTKKESVMKMTGLGLSLPMDLYDIRGSQAVAAYEKICAWYEKELKKGQIKTELARAAHILLQETMYLKEYCYERCRIAVCSTSDQFDLDYVLAKPCALGI